MRCGYADEYIGIHQHLCQRTSLVTAVGDLRHFFLLGVQIVSALIDRTVAVAEDHMVRIQTHSDQQADDCQTGQRLRRW